MEATNKSRSSKRGRDIYAHVYPGKSVPHGYRWKSQWHTSYKIVPKEKIVQINLMKLKEVWKSGREKSLKKASESDKKEKEKVVIKRKGSCCLL